jgi:hypothetical protein
MKITHKTELRHCLFVILLAVPTDCVIGQQAAEPRTPPPELNLPAAVASSGAFAGSEVFREIDDPTSGARWLLLRDKSHPASPGKMVRVSVGFKGGSEPAEGSGPGSTLHSIPATSCPILRVGDLLIAVESSSVLESHLEAVALGPAVAGSSLNVRLKIGGTVVRAIAQAPGRVILLPAAGGWR